jgi:hypothetical protein
MKSSDDVEASDKNLDAVVELMNWGAVSYVETT